MSNGGWTLDQDSELNVLIPWLDREPDREKRARVLEWLGGLLRNPDRPRVMDAPNVFSAHVPRTDVAVIWHLDPADKVVQVSHIGPI